MRSGCLNAFSKGNHQMKKMAIIGLLTVGLAGCESTAEVLNSTARVLNSTSAVLGGTSSTSSSSSAQGSYTQKPNAQQQAQLNTALTYKASNTQLKQAITEAKPVIYQFLEVASCQLTGRGTYLNGVARITSSERDHFVAMYKPSNHPEGKCLNVERVDSWEMVAKNAFDFRVLFVSEESGESRIGIMGMRKEDGEWRVYRFYDKW